VSPCVFPEGDMEILAGSAHHVPGGLVLRDRSRASLIRHFLLVRGETFSSKLPSLQGGDTFIFSFPTKGEGLA
jgi:hypothetical protein